MYQLTDKSDNKENIMKFLDSKLIHFLLKITQFSEAPNYINEFKILNMITKPNNGTLKTDADIYKYYGINSQEQKLIDEVVNHVKPNKRTPKQTFNVKNEKVIGLKTGITEPEPEIVEEPEAEPMKEHEPEPMKEKKPDKPKTVKKSKCTKVHPPPPCPDTMEVPEGKECCYKKKSLYKSKCLSKAHPPPPCSDNMEVPEGKHCCYKKKRPKKATIRKKASIRKKSTIRKKHKRKNNKRTIRKRGR